MEMANKQTNLVMHLISAINWISEVVLTYLQQQNSVLALTANLNKWVYERNLSCQVYLLMSVYHKRSTVEIVSNDIGYNDEPDITTE